MDHKSSQAIVCLNFSRRAITSTLPNFILPGLKIHFCLFQNDFTLIEYTSGPCTADKVILQADKFGSSLMDCVSSDFVMDKGLAKHFKRAFQHKEALQESGL